MLLNNIYKDTMYLIFPSPSAYGIYISQLICYARACSNYQGFMA